MVLLRLAQSLAEWVPMQHVLSQFEALLRLPCRLDWRPALLEIALGFTILAEPEGRIGPAPASAAASWRFRLRLVRKAASARRSSPTLANISPICSCSVALSPTVAARSIISASAWGRASMRIR